MWDQVIAAAMSAVEANPVLSTLYNAGERRIRLAGTGEHLVPLLEMTLIADDEDELYAPATIQWDQFTESMTNLIASELALRAIFHRDLPALIGNVRMFAGYQGSETLAQPDRDNYFGRAVRFRLTPLRKQYQPVPL